MRLKGGVRRFQDGGANFAATQNPGWAAIMGSPQMQANLAAARSPNQPTSATSGWQPPTGGPQATPAQLAAAGGGNTFAPTPQQISAMRGAGINPGGAVPGGSPAASPGAAAAAGAAQMSPQQQAAMQQFMQQRAAAGAQQGAGVNPQQQMMMRGAGVNAPNNPMPPAGGANPQAAQLAARGAMPMPAQGGGPASPMGAGTLAGLQPGGGGMPPGGSSFGAAPGGGPPPGGGMWTGGGQAPTPSMTGQAALNAAAQRSGVSPQQLSSYFQQQAGGMAKGGRVKGGSGSMQAAKGTGSSFNSTKAAPGNLATRPGKAKMAEGGAVEGAPKKKKKSVLHRKPHKKAAAEGPPPVPIYDTEDAGDGGQPPTPSFTGGPGPQGPTPTPAPGPPAPPPAMRKGGACEDKDKDGMAKGGECDKMAAGGVAKVRKGFPDTIKGSKKKMKFASGGRVRGTGAAQRGTKFSGIF